MPSSISILMGVKIVVIMQLLFLLLLLLLFPDGSFGHEQQHSIKVRRHLATDDPVPTCQKLVETEKFYFPNDCVTKCTERGGTFDTGRSRNVNGKMKCFCVDDDTPVCTDEPMCADLSINPGTAFDDCMNNVCLPSMADGDKTTPVVDVTDDVEYAGDPNAANKDQTHFLISCSCDGGETSVCGTDYILFSDKVYLPSCTAEFDTSADKVNTLNINSSTECNDYCTNANKNFIEGEWEIMESNPPKFACACIDKDYEDAAKACDDSLANYNDGSRGGGDDCYDEVGLNKVDCNPPESSAVGHGTAQKNIKIFYTHVVAVILFMLIVMCYRGVL